MFCISYRRNGSSLYPRWAVSRSRQSGRYDKSEVTDDRHSPGLAETRDLAVLAQRIFQTPVAFLALLDHTEQVTARIGIGEEWWSVIEGFPLRRAFEDAPIAPDTAQWLPEGCNAGGLGFFAATPVRSCTGMPLGLLILADYSPGHGFPDADRQALRTLVNAFTANMELRALASHALEGELRWLETEKRFRAIANSARRSSSMEDRTRPDVRQQPVAGIHRPEHAGRDGRWLERLYPSRIPAACARGLRAGL
jgi:hypothetical protein